MTGCLGLEGRMGVSAVGTGVLGDDVRCSKMDLNPLNG